MKLYQIADEILALEAIIDEAGDQADESLRAALDALGMDAQTKIDSLHKWHRELSATADAFKSESDRLKALAQSKSNKADSVKRYVHAMVQILGGKVETTIGPLGLQQSGGKAQLVLPDDISAVPQVYIKHTPTIDKDALRADIESAMALANADDEQGQQALGFLQELEKKGIFIAPRGMSLRGI